MERPCFVFTSQCRQDHGKHPQFHTDEHRDPELTAVYCKIDAGTCPKLRYPEDQHLLAHLPIQKAQPSEHMHSLSTQSSAVGFWGPSPYRTPRAGRIHGVHSVQALIPHLRVKQEGSTRKTSPPPPKKRKKPTQKTQHQSVLFSEIQFTYPWSEKWGVPENRWGAMQTEGAANLHRIHLGQSLAAFNPNLGSQGSSWKETTPRGRMLRGRPGDSFNCKTFCSSWWENGRGSI